MDKKEQEEKQLIEWERVAAKQIKNTFADVKEIRFDKDSIDRNVLSGDAGVNAFIKTKDKEDFILVILPVNKEEKKLTSYIGNDLQEGKTITLVEVTYTNGKVEKL